MNLAAVTSACGGSGTLDVGNALDLGATEGEICVPAPDAAEDATMFGDTWLRHQADAPVTITEIVLVDPQQMEIRDAVLVHIDPGEDLVGMRNTSNPAPFPAGWDNRVSAKGAVIEPGDEWNLVVTVDALGTELASAKATRINYETDDGATYRQDTLTTLVVSQERCEDFFAD